MINKKEDLVGTIFNISDDEGVAIVRLAGIFYDVCTKYKIRVMGGNGRDYFMKAVGEGLVNLCISLDDDIEGDLVAFGRASIDKGSVYGAYSKSMCNFKSIREEDLILHLDNPKTKEVEWENGERCIYDGSEYTFVGMTPTFSDDSCIVFDSKNGIEHVCVRKLSKPETPEAKKEREELESAYDLYCVAFGDSEHLCDSFENFCKEDAHKFCRNAYIAIVRKTGYRVGK